MRFHSASLPILLAGALGLASCGAPATSARPVPEVAERPVRPLVLLLHGRGLLGRDTTRLRRAWESSLRSGAMALSQAPILGDSDVRLVWYADVLDSQSDAACSFAPGDPRARRVMGGDQALQILATGAGNVIGILGGLFGDGEADTQIRDVAGDLQYLGDAGKRCAAERRLTNALAEAHREGRPVILVAHSFGSLVAYDALTARDTGGPVIERMVTIGAMIGAPVLRHLLFGGSDADTLALPTGVKSWINVRNPGDPLAVPLSPLGRAEHGASAAIRDTTTSNADDDPDTHEMIGYLRDTVTARAVLSAWCEAFRPATARPEGCARLEAASVSR